MNIKLDNILYGNMFVVIFLWVQISVFISDRMHFYGESHRHYWWFSKTVMKSPVRGSHICTPL